MQKIDVFSHILPAKYLNALSQKGGKNAAEALNCKRRLNDLDVFNRSLMNYLIWHNTEKPHRGIGKKPHCVII